MIFMVFFYLAFAVLMFLPLLGTWFMVRCMPDPQRSLILVTAATLLLTPSWGPATITVVLVPFGFLFIVTLFTWSWSELAGWVSLFPLWHAIAFSATALISYFVIRKLPSNKSFTANASGAA
ncbi:hypothetical protein DWU99_16985 [Dyella psychrodurans]|uniref:Uncharacterized protein n=1 Tax=Dyella psychrodurans TaxID=1927960 RepID=A0A370WZ33_9GAMM|nr:hypothetical protein DWU99_16985 [Dyella psychrodurans]